MFLTYSVLREYEEMACGVLNIFDMTSDDWMNCVLLLQEIPYYRMNCLKMANQARCLKFISLPAVQDILDRIWSGRCVIKPGLKGGLEVNAFYSVKNLIKQLSVSTNDFVVFEVRRVVFEHRATCTLLFVSDSNQISNSTLLSQFFFY